ncbi:MAG: putative diguanylate cyclase [Xanthobacteraceae bacterium]|jgi:diguanylate cyclase (GGDEF)-like protein|nr:putative diguanylate cyclase [Xanthobacteraceae bacterium]
MYADPQKKAAIGTGPTGLAGAESASVRTPAGATLQTRLQPRGRRILMSSVDDRHKVARFGGEEFIVLSHGDDCSDLAALGERMRHAIESTPVPHGNDTLTVTVSRGIALTSGADRDLHGLIERADAALYMAKNGGRNRVAVAPTKRAA